MTGVSRVISRGSRPFRWVERWSSRARTRCLVVTSARFYGWWTTRSRSTFVLFVTVTTVRSVGLITPRTLACPRNSKSGEPVAERNFVITGDSLETILVWCARPFPSPLPLLPCLVFLVACVSFRYKLVARRVHGDSKASCSLFPGLDNWIYASRESLAWMACLNRDRTMAVWLLAGNSGYQFIDDRFLEKLLLTSVWLLRLHPLAFNLRSSLEPSGIEAVPADEPADFPPIENARVSNCCVLHLSKRVERFFESIGKRIQTFTSHNASFALASIPITESFPAMSQSLATRGRGSNFPIAVGSPTT